MRTMNMASRLSAVILFALPFAGLSTAHAAISQVVLFRGPNFSQVSSAAPVAADSYGYSARIFVDNAADFDGGTLAYPGPGSPAAYSVIPDSTEPAGMYLMFRGPDEANQAALDADFPFGTYTSTATNSVTSTSQTSSVSYTLNAYPLSIPALTPDSYTNLQALNPAIATTVNFNTFATNANANDSEIFFDVYDALGNLVLDQSFLPADATDAIIPANTLSPNTAYTYTLVFSERINSTNADDGVTDVLGYDYATSGTVVTTPEPASLALLTLVGPVLLLKRRR